MSNVENPDRSFQKSASKISDPSKSVNEINVPEVDDFKIEFVYNFFTKDERVRPFSNTSLPITRVPRYCLLTWTSPSVSTADLQNSDTFKQNFKKLEEVSSDIVSEDSFFNPGYITHTFSNYDAVEQGNSDLENYSRLSRQESESLYDMSSEQLKEIFLSTDEEISQTYKKMVMDDYSRLADFPSTALGLRVLSKDGLPTRDDSDLIRSISNDLSLSFKINAAVIPDIFKNSSDTLISSNYKEMDRAYSESLKGANENSLKLKPITSEKANSLKTFSQEIKLLGYIIDRYLVKQDGFRKDATFYIDDIGNCRFEDKTVLYGGTYVYTIRIVASVPILTYGTDESQVYSSTFYVASRAISCATDCFEYTPPPEPQTLKFNFDYEKRNLIINWEMPINHQRDVKQFQVFRRKSIKEPFELIAQYGFDDSEVGSYGERYKTDERVDANNLDRMTPELKYLVRTQDSRMSQPYPVFMHVDEDFTVDPEFFISSEYIYAVCSVDAHGMISNYSSQHHVTFDSYKNKLVTRIICDSGSPKQYPNMNLRTDAFKDVIKLEGDSARRLDLYFTPEYLSLKDDRNFKLPVVHAQTQTNKDPYYLLQLINLDNQKMQILKINIKDPNNLTTVNLTG